MKRQRTYEEHMDWVTGKPPGSGVAAMFLGAIAASGLVGGLALAVFRGLGLSDHIDIVAGALALGAFGYFETLGVRYWRDWSWRKTVERQAMIAAERQQK